MGVLDQFRQRLRSMRVQAQRLKAANAPRAVPMGMSPATGDIASQFGRDPNTGRPTYQGMPIGFKGGTGDPYFLHNCDPIGIPGNQFVNGVYYGPQAESTGYMRDAMSRAGGSIGQRVTPVIGGAGLQRPTGTGGAAGTAMPGQAPADLGGGRAMSPTGEVQFYPASASSNPVQSNNIEIPEHRRGLGWGEEAPPYSAQGQRWAEQGIRPPRPYMAFQPGIYRKSIRETGSPPAGYLALYGRRGPSQPTATPAPTVPPGATTGPGGEIIVPRDLVQGPAPAPAQPTPAPVTTPQYAAPPAQPSVNVAPTLTPSPLPPPLAPTTTVQEPSVGEWRPGMPLPGSLDVVAPQYRSSGGG